MSGEISNQSVTNELLLKYDDKFNQNYIKIVDLNSSIMNKEELITKENDLITNSSYMILLLQYGVGLIIVLGIAFILYGMGYFSFTLYVIFSIVLIILYTILVYYLLNQVTAISNMTQYLQSLEVDVVDYVNSYNDNTNQCPTGCTTQEETSNEPTVQLKQTPTLNIDPQTNVWNYGDIPEDGWTSANLPANTFYSNPTNIPSYYNIENSAQPFFGGNMSTDSFKTYYQCQNLGNNNGLAQSTGYTTIPCYFMENTQETGRYICKEDPNQNGISENNCQNVSNYINA